MVDSVRGMHMTPKMSCTPCGHHQADRAKPSFGVEVTLVGAQGCSRNCEEIVEDFFGTWKYRAKGREEK